MTDVVDAATRSRMMSGIRGRNTKPEMLIRSLLHRQGLRFRLHAKELPGKPDMVFPRYRAVIFVHGCFWHGHDCPLFKWPATRAEFWHDKIRKNRENDRRSIDSLLTEGWRVCVVWECSMRGAGKDIDGLVQRVADWIRGSEPFMEARG